YQGENLADTDRYGMGLSNTNAGYGSSQSGYEVPLAGPIARSNSVPSRNGYPNGEIAYADDNANLMATQRLVDEVRQRRQQRRRSLDNDLRGPEVKEQDLGQSRSIVSTARTDNAFAADALPNEDGNLAARATLRTEDLTQLKRYTDQTTRVANLRVGGAFASLPETNPGSSRAAMGRSVDGGDGWTASRRMPIADPNPQSVSGVDESNFQRLDYDENAVAAVRQRTMGASLSSLQNEFSRLLSRGANASTVAPIEESAAVLLRGTSDYNQRRQITTLIDRVRRYQDVARRRQSISPPTNSGRAFQDIAGRDAATRR
ncbi:MAG: hypothetical protein AAFP90_18245, partial [Planctomycetota bacterium]